jgi:hypothetical protein
MKIEIRVIWAKESLSKQIQWKIHTRTIISNHWHWFRLRTYLQRQFLTDYW